MRLTLAWDPDETAADLDGGIAIHFNVRTCSARQLHFFEAREPLEYTSTRRPRERCCKMHGFRIHSAPAAALAPALERSPSAKDVVAGCLPAVPQHPCHIASLSESN